MLGKLLRLLSRRQGAAGGQFRESSSRTTIHLLEMNRKFELFMRAKVRKLEERVSRLQARPGQEQAEDWIGAEDYAVARSDDGDTVDTQADEEMSGSAQTAPPGVSSLGGWQAVNEVAPAPLSVPVAAIGTGLSDGEVGDAKVVEIEEAESSSSPAPMSASVIPAGGGVSLLIGNTATAGTAGAETMETSSEPVLTVEAVGLDGNMQVLVLERWWAAQVARERQLADVRGLVLDEIGGIAHGGDVVERNMEVHALAAKLEGDVLQVAHKRALVLTASFDEGNGVAGCVAQ